MLIMKFQSIITIFAFLFLASAASINEKRGGPLKPSQDPFYTPQPGFESQPLGAILDHREITSGFGVVLFKYNIKSAHQFLVRSQDSHGNANAIVTTVLEPWNAKPGKVLSYQTAEDATNIDCAPSYVWQFRSSILSWGSTEFEQLLANVGLYEGWYVVVPDQLGPQAAWLAAYQAAYATLDSLKAVLSSGDITGISSDADVALWGYSGGSQPSVWGAALAPTYAPDINIVGVAAGGILTDLKVFMDANDSQLTASLIVMSLNGLSNEYPELKAYLSENIYPSIQKKFYLTNQTCEDEGVILDLFSSWDEISPKGAALLDDPIVTKILDENNILLLNATPKAPLFFFEATNDEIVPSQDVQSLYTNWCAEGTSIYFSQDLASEHITQAIFASGDVLVWLRDRFNGVPQTGCQKVNSFSVLFNTNSVVGLSTLVLDIFKLVFNVPTGPLFPFTKRDLPSIAQGLPSSFSASNVTQASSLSSISSYVSQIQNQLQKILPSSVNRTTYPGGPWTLSNPQYVSPVLELSSIIGGLGDEIVRLSNPLVAASNGTNSTN